MVTKPKWALLRTAFVKSLPILFSYVFVAMAYGMMMEQAGFGWYVSLFISLTVYTGAFQFVLITFLSAGASLATVVVTALLMNSRQTFYSLSFVKDFQAMGRRKLYMIHTMTDETYAVNCALDLPEEDKREVMFWVALFSRWYWMVGAVIGGVVGQLIPVQLEGIDFCMTALFVIILIDQWEHTKDHRPALAGLGIGILALAVFGESRFMLPALLLVSGVLLLWQRREGTHET